LDNDETARALTTFVHAVVQDPELGKLGHATLTRVAKSPEFRGSLKRFVTNF
jgi:hypothetical protein